MHWHSEQYNIPKIYYYVLIKVCNSYILYVYMYMQYIKVIQSGSDSKESACSAGNPDLIPTLGIFPGEGSDYPLQYYCWLILWTQDPDRLQSMGLQRVGYDWVTNTFHFHTIGIYKRCI